MLPAGGAIDSDIGSGSFATFSSRPRNGYPREVTARAETAAVVYDNAVFAPEVQSILFLSPVAGRHQFRNAGARWLPPSPGYAPGRCFSAEPLCSKASRLGTPGPATAM